MDMLFKKHEPIQSIDSLQAETLLRYDFDKAFNLTDTTLSYNKRLALAHFIYAVGIGTYNKKQYPYSYKKEMNILVLLY